MSQVHTKFTLRAESRGVLPFIVDLQNRDPYDIPEETDAIVKVTDIGLAHGINVLQSGANITAVREHFDWAQPMTVREYLRADWREARPESRGGARGAGGDGSVAGGAVRGLRERSGGAPGTVAEELEAAESCRY